MTPGPTAARGVVRAILLACVLGAASCDRAHEGPARSLDTEPADSLIVPGTRVGPVDSSLSERRLIERLGAGNVVRRDAYIGEGICAPGSVIYPGTPDSIVVTWADSTYVRPAVATVMGEGSRWRTPAGVHIGSTLVELERLNGGQPIRFSGFGWDYGGRVSWQENGGPELVLVISPDSASYARFARDPRTREIYGDHAVASDHPLVRTMNVTVRAISMRWAEPTVQYDCR